MKFACLQPVAAVLLVLLSVGTVRAADHVPRVSSDLIDRFDKSASSAGEQAGVGITLARRDGRLVVGRVLPGKPAALSGSVQVGDRLVFVGQGDKPPVRVEKMSINQAVALIRGTKGTPVILTVVPSGKQDSDAIVVPLIRGVFKELNFFGDGRLLPSGTKAPDLTGVLLPGGGTYDLNQSTGQIVVLEFWATWCGPCLNQLDHIQDLRKQHPNWKDRVQLIAVGIDDEKGIASRCVATRGTRWKDLTIVWSSPEILKSFHIAALPGVYLLDRNGRVLPQSPEADLAMSINKALTAEANRQPPK